MKATGLWALREWRLAYPAASISKLGDLVFEVTLVLWITTEIGKGETWAPAAVSAAFIAGAVPVLAVAPLAGALVDRWDKRRMLVVSNLVQAGSVASLLVLASVWRQLPTLATLIWLLTAILVTNSADQFVLGGRLAMIAKTVPEAFRTKAFSVQNSTYSILGIVGPPLAAPLLFGVGIWAALSVDAVSFAASAILLYRCRWHSSPEVSAASAPFVRSLVAGWRLIFAESRLRAVMTCLTVFTFATSVMNVLEIFVVTEVLNTRASLLGVLLFAYALGTLVGAVAAPRVERRIGTETTFAWGLLLAGTGGVVFSLCGSFDLALTVAFLMAIPIGLVTTVLVPMFLRSVPSDALGRASAALNALPAAASLLGMAIAGWLETKLLASVDFQIAGFHFGPINTLFACAALLIVLAGISARSVLVTAPIAGDGRS